jgi:hypothetical protein
MVDWVVLIGVFMVGRMPWDGEEVLEKSAVRRDFLWLGFPAFR